MSDGRCILVFGADAMLLDTRRRLLEHAGFSVALSINLEDTERELRSQKISLLLLCYTLHTEDCERAIALAHSINPEIVTLALETGSGPCTQDSDVAIHQMSGPQKLVHTVQTILQ